ncbi:hypothetical protein [Pseudonocardia spinosispora]|uniref:hypothetical protein n=1 Tax=Pseudonocardia spinosispora TaxID=103441 RepID=UPI0003F80B70|nr:hypothetical protein [Pseudonocardia spinosispora]
MTTPLPDVLARGLVPSETLARWGADIAESLATAHASGTVHGDVRADAVGIDTNGSARLEGFGASGTPRHPAPEQADGAAPSASADVYALGAMLYQSGGAVAPGMAGVWPWLGHSDPDQRPSATQAAERLRTFAEATPQAAPTGVSTPKPRRRTPWVIAAVIGVVLLGAAALVFFAPVRSLFGGTSQPSGYLTAAPLGDVRTADPCLMLDDAALQRFGTTTRFPDGTSPSGCAVWIQPASGDGTWVYLWLSNPTLSDADLKDVPFQRFGGMTLYQSKGSCQRTVLLPDRSRAVLWVNRYRNSTLDSCALTDAAVPGVLGALSTPNLPRRKPAGPPNSIVGLTACALGDDAALRAVPGLDVGRREPQYGDWECEWGDSVTDDASTAQIRLTRDIQQQPWPGTLSGRSSQTFPSDPGESPSSCSVDLVQRTFPGPNSRTVAELLVVTVHITKAPSPDAQCAAATAIAQAAAAKLPPPG